MKRVLLLLIFFLPLFISQAFTQNKKLNLEINILPELQDLLLDQNLTVTVFWDTTIQKHIVVKDKSFNISFDSLTSSKINVSLFCEQSNSDFSKTYRLIVGSLPVSSDSTSITRIVFPKDCDFNKNRENKICPNCKKTNRVIPIVYGLPDLENPSKKSGQKIYDAGCFVSDCDPSWYCKRDKTKF